MICPKCSTDVIKARMEETPEYVLFHCCGYVVCKDPPALVVDAAALHNEERRTNGTARGDDDGKPRCRRELTCVSCGKAILREYAKGSVGPKRCRACAKEHDARLGSERQKKYLARKRNQRAEMAEKGTGA